MKIRKFATLLIILAFGVLAFPFGAVAVVDWTKYSTSSVLPTGGSGAWDEKAVERPMVIKDGSTYKMWYYGKNTSDEWRLGYATSSDGATWSKYGSTPVLTPESSGWDSNHVGAAWVIQESSSSYKMWYTGTDNTDDDVDAQIGYATSTDGITWNKYGSNPVVPYGATDDWDGDGVGWPTVIKDGTTYKMWYDGFNDTQGTIGIGHATSTDGITWNKHTDGSGSDPYANSDPVIEKGPTGHWTDEGPFTASVIKDDSLYRMWFSGEQSSGSDSIERIGYAYSLDGINWRAYDGNPIIFEGGTGDFDETGVLDAMVLKDGNTYKMWYVGDDGSTPYSVAEIGYATSNAWQGDDLDIEDRAVWTRNTSGGMMLCVACGPYGPGPLDMNEIKVDGPTGSGWGYLFGDWDIQNVSNWQLLAWCQSNSSPPSGQYDFTLRANNGLSDTQSVTLSPSTISVPTDGSSPGQLARKIVVGATEYTATESYIGSTTPTFKWKPTNGNTTGYYYRVWVHDWRGRAHWWVSDLVEGSETDVTGFLSMQAPDWAMKDNTPYHWRVEVLDTDDPWSGGHNRAWSDVWDFYTGTKDTSATPDFLLFVGLISYRQFISGDGSVAWAGVINLAPWDIDTTTSGNEFRVEDPSSPFYYYNPGNNAFPSDPFPFMYNSWLIQGFAGTNGTYTFYVYDDGTTNNESMTKSYTENTGLPQVDRTEMSPADNTYLTTNTPTLSWKSKGTVYYHRVRILDWNGRRHRWSSTWTNGVAAGGDMSVDVPDWVLTGGPYRWYVEVSDGNSSSSESNRTISNRLTINAPDMEGPGDELAVDFGNSGLYHYDGQGGWNKISTGNAYLLAEYDGDLAAAFTGSSLYVYDGAWTKISTGEPDDMIAGGMDLFVDFGTSGLYHYDGAWTKISTADAEGLETYDGKLVADFGTSGLYEYNNGAWTRISTGNAEDVAGGGSDLFVDFGASGLYKYDGAWTKISTADAEDLETYAGKLVADFGTSGLYEYDNGIWTKISTGDPEGMIAEGMDLFVDFGTSGLYKYDGAWNKISTADAEDLEIYANGKLAADFGISGLYEYDDGAWTKISTGDADDMVDVDIN